MNSVKFFKDFLNESLCSWWKLCASFIAIKNEVSDVKGISTVLCNQYELNTKNITLSFLSIRWNDHL